jgi:hypothetical protein
MLAGGFFNPALRGRPLLYLAFAGRPFLFLVFADRPRYHG